MSPMVKNILGVVAGVLIGSTVNMGIINASGAMIPPPAGADVTTMEGLKASMHMFGPQHYLFPFLAHALGTLAGAAVVAFMAATRKFELALLVGVVFLAGGISAVVMLPAPLWFEVLDLVAAYLPMAWLGWKIGARNGAARTRAA